MARGEKKKAQRRGGKKKRPREGGKIKAEEGRKERWEGRN